MQYSENLNFNLPEMTDPPDISKLIENWSNLDPIIQNIIIGLTQVGNAAKVNGYTVNANVPEGAKFTDTVTTVNGKTGAIAKADIVALGIPAQDTVYSVATQTDDGLMDSEDKEKLDGVQEGAVAITIGTQQPLVGLWFEEYI